MKKEAQITLQGYDFAIANKLDLGVIMLTPNNDTLRIEQGTFVCSNYGRVIEALKNDANNPIDVYASTVAKGLLTRIRQFFSFWVRAVML